MNDKRPRIAVIGSTNVDFCSYVARLPQAGETIGNGVFMQYAVAPLFGVPLIMLFNMLGYNPVIALSC